MWDLFHPRQVRNELGCLDTFTLPFQNSRRLWFFLGEWYGIEWEDNSRGKHDGTHEGIKYFECKYVTSDDVIRTISDCWTVFVAQLLIVCKLSH